MEKEHDWQTIHGLVPSKSNQYRIVYVAGHSKLGKTAATERYEKQFYLQVGTYRNLMIKGFFEFYVRCYFNSTRQDLDNSLKVILDCLQMTRTIRNDNQCVKIVAEKFVDKTDPRIEFQIIEVTDK